MCLRFVCVPITPAALVCASAVTAQRYAGPFEPRPGMLITTVFSNEFGHDADSTASVTAVTPNALYT